VAKSYGNWCKRSRERERSSPRGCGDRKIRRRKDDDDDRRRKGSGSRGERCCRGSPEYGSPGIVAWRSCEGARGVREVLGSPATKNFRGGAAHRRRFLRGIPVM
jgi:hypothetical protein